MSPSCGVRRATAQDLGSIASLIQPQVAVGKVLPRAIVAEDFLVSERAGQLVGCVALTRWTDEVIELGTLISAQPGQGRRLVEAACERARARGHHKIVALTAVPGFFLRCGFGPQEVPPWALARGLNQGDASVAEKARTCAKCPRLASCAQVLLARPLRSAA